MHKSIQYLITLMLCLVLHPRLSTDYPLFKLSIDVLKQLNMKSHPNGINSSLGQVLISIEGTELIL